MDVENCADFDSGALPVSDLLLETDSEGGGVEHQILLQSDSDQEELLASPTGSDGIMLATDSENEGGEPPAKKPRRYATQRTGSHELVFLHKPVCRFAHIRLYSIGSGSLQNVRRGLKAYSMHSGRVKEPHHPSLGVSLVRSAENKRWPSIMSFFWLLWMSCAEILPVKFTMPGQDGTFVESTMSKDPDFQERYVQNFLACLEKNYDMNPATHSQSRVVAPKGFRFH